MFHGLHGSQPLLVVVAEKLVEEVEGFRSDEVLVFRVDESLPTFARVSAENIGEARVQLNLVLVQILVELLSAQHLGDANELKSRK